MHGPVCVRLLKLLFIFLLSVSTGVTNAQLVANFKSTDTAGCAPLIVGFGNLSSNATSYSWNLGNGVTSNLRNVSGSYVTAGTYTVTLTAFDATSSRDTSVVIRVYGKPVVDFYSSDTAVCPVAPVTFTSTSTPNCWGFLSYTWNFGDGGSDLHNNPTYGYGLPGRYNVTLFAQNAKGCINTYTRTGYMNVFKPPATLFAAPSSYFCKAPGVVSFTNSTSGKPPLTYTWTFGDGTSSTAVSPTHSYTVPGNYSVRLSATDVNGCKDSLIQPDFAGVSGFKASFTAIPNGCLFIPLKFVYTGSAYKSIKWDFGDGTILVNDTGFHSYTHTGSYTVKLVAGNDTCLDSVTHVISIQKPSGSFAVSQRCSPPSTLSFVASRSPSDSVMWLFGDNTSSTGATAIHTYTPPPVFPKVIPQPDPVYGLSMIVTSIFGCNDTVTKVDTIKNLVSTLFTSAPTFGCLPLTTHFVNDAQYKIIDPRSSGASPGLLIFPYPYGVTSYSWNYGDGSPLSSTVSPSHTYTATGIYYATCSITTADGCSSKDTMEVDVGTPQTASFVASKTRACAGQPIVYTSTSTSTSLIDNYAWIYGDGKNDEGPTDVVVVHRSEAPGIHTVKLNVFNNGCKSPDFTVTDTIEAANATILNRYTCIPANGMMLFDSSVGDDTHLWEFGDGTTSTLTNPVHFYPSQANYKVTLTTFNFATGCRDTGSIVVELQRLKPTLKPYRTSLCRDVADTFTSVILSTDSTNAIKCRWYNNGTLTDIHVPVALPLVPYKPIDYTDTIRHAMTTRGVNNIMLVVTDNHNCLDTTTTTVLVAKPIDSFFFTPPAVCPSSSVNFTDVTKDVPGTTIAAYYWSFGDFIKQSATGPAISHVYTNAGTYTVTERVVDNLGCADTFTATAQPLVHRPKAAFVASSTYTCSSTTISFNNTSTGSYTYLWIFGDGATSTAPLPVHTYTTSGSYDVTLVSYDAFGCSDSAYKPHYVLVNPLPVASFYLDDSFAVCPPLNVSFVNTSTGATFNQWDLGDGTSSVAVYPANIYVAPGIYTIKLKVSNAYGCIDTTSRRARVFGYVGAFTYNPDTVCSTAPVHFQAVLSDVTNIVWDFGDGVLSPPSLLDTISHTFAAPGSYMPKLFLTDVSGCTKFSYGADTIKVDSVYTAFTASPDPVCPNNSVSFHDASYSLFSSAKAWLWSFAPGATSTASAPVYAYSVSGTQTITLQLTDGLGCTALATGSVNVLPGPGPIAGTTRICLGATSALSDNPPAGTWSSSNTSIAPVSTSGGVLTGAATGTAAITYTMTNGCRTTAGVTIDPVPLPIGGSKRLCTGSSATLSDGLSGGIWTSANTAVATIGSGSGLVNGIAAGTASITYRFPAGCFAVTTVTVDTSPSAILPVAAIVCEGNTVTMSNAVSGGSWISSSTGTATIGSASGTLTGIAAGTTAITYTLGSGCSIATTASVNPLPAAITGTTSVCAGGEVSLTDVTAGGAWSISGTAIATVGSAGTVAGISAGKTDITYTLPTACMVTVSFTVNPLPAAITGKKDVCTGFNTTLSDATAGGIWTSSATCASISGSTGTVTGIAPGTAAITYTLGTGCIAADSVIVNPLPTAVLGTKNMCLGFSTTLSDATAPGTWSTSSTAVVVGATTGIVTGMSTGTATVTYTLPTGCLSTDDVTVNRLPSAITGDTLICVGATTSLTDTLTGGTWASGAPGVATIDAAGTATGTGAGTATITYTSPLGCTAMTTVTVNPYITPIKGPSSVCKGAAAMLSDDIAGGTWSSSNTFASVSASGIVTGIAAGSTTISYSALNVCGTATAIITVKPLPYAGSITGPVKVCSGTAISLTDTVSGGDWTAGNSAVASVDATGTVFGVTAGTVLISYTSTNSCGKATAVQTVTVNLTPPHARISTHPDTIACSNTLFRNFGADAPEPAGFHYNWTVSNASIYAMAANRQYCLISFHSAGTGIIRLSTDQVSTECGSMDSLVYHIGAEVAPQPVVVYYPPELVCKDNTAESYQWGYDDAVTLDSTLLAGMVNQNYYIASPDFKKNNYWVMTLHDGCLQKSYYNAPLGINRPTAANNMEIHLYPNPAGDIINIEIKGVSRLDITEAKLFDMLGKERKIVSIIDGVGSMQLAGLSPGVYMVVLSSKEVKIGSKVFVKE